MDGRPTTTVGVGDLWLDAPPTPMNAVIPTMKVGGDVAAAADVVVVVVAFVVFVFCVATVLRFDRDAAISVVIDIAPKD